jgi:hypothetical protein
MLDYWGLIYLQFLGQAFQLIVLDDESTVEQHLALQIFTHIVDHFLESKK